MTSATYTALGDCARRRIEQEWTCTAAERAVLQLIADLSFGLNQTWAYVPCLADFAAVLGVHKSTVCRALRGALKKGYLEVLQRREETLYTLNTQTRGTLAEGGQDEAAAVRRRLVELNQSRCQGQADPDGQQRLPGVMPSEETGAAAAAFEAMMESATDATPGPIHAPNPAPREMVAAGDEEESQQAFHARLESLVRAAERRRGEVESGAAPPPDPPPPRSQAAIFDEAMEKLCRGLKGETLFVLQAVRAEVQTRGNLQEAAFFKYGHAWRRRAQDHLGPLREAVGEHKNLRLTQGAAKEPGAWIFSRMRMFTESGTS